jgi:hypothetical protein
MAQAVASTPTASATPESERSLSLLVEGAAMNMPEIDHESYKVFRANVTRTALSSPDRLPAADKLAAIKTIVHEFEHYRNGAEAALRDRLTGWRAITSTLFSELLTTLGIDPKSDAALPLEQMIGRIKTSGEIQEFRDLLDAFLHPTGAESIAERASALKAADHSTANDNAAGLRGGGVAIEQVKRIMERGSSGFAAVFRLSCLEIISQRFGADAVEDCIMAVSAYLTSSLHADDAIYHWTDSSLLSILQGRANESILTAELQRISAHNSEINIKVGDRMIMLRIPLSFDIIPISKLKTADDLYVVSRDQRGRW